MRYRISQWRHQVRDLESHRGFRQLEVLVRHRRQQVDELSASLAAGLRLRLATTMQRLTRASSKVVSFDLRGRAEIARRRIAQQHGALTAALDRVMTRKRRRFATAEVRFAALDLRARFGRLGRKLEQRMTELGACLDRALIAKRRRWQAAALQLEERSPFRILERGFAIVYDASGKVLRSVDQVDVGDDIAVRLARGELDATVRRKKTT
jgi:exodeoxyribonuclease VII large subunit